MASACGMRAPPLPPLVILPETVPLTVTRIDSEVYIGLHVPTRNSDGSALDDLDRIELYALTTHPDSERPIVLAFEDWLEVATLVAEIPASDLETPDDDDTTTSEDGDEEATADATAAGDETPEPAGAGDVVILEPLTAEVRTPPSLEDFLEDEDEEDEDEELNEGEALIGPLMAKLPVFPRRTYRAVAVTARGRESAPSPPRAVTLAAPTPAPGPAVVTYTEADVLLEWTPPPTARVPLQAAAVDGILESTPILALGTPSTYRVYAFSEEEALDGTTESGSQIELEPPLAPPPLAALNPQDLDITTYTEPGVEFGVNRCYMVRVVDRVDDLPVIGPSSSPTCVVPVDTFPPSRPTGLIAVASEGAISLVWDGSPQSDVVGYVVLRGDAPGATLGRLTVEPVDDTAYRDTTVVADQRYVYAVQAVDGAETPNLSLPSSEVTEQAR